MKNLSICLFPLVVSLVLLLSAEINVVNAQLCVPPCSEVTECCIRGNLITLIGRCVQRPEREGDACDDSCGCPTAFECEASKCTATTPEEPEE